MPVPAGPDAKTSTAPLLSRSARSSRAAPGEIPEPDSGQEAITSCVHPPPTIDSRRIVPALSSVTSSSAPSASTSPSARAILGATPWLGLMSRSNCPAWRLPNTCTAPALVNHRGIRIAVEVDVTPDKGVNTCHARKGLDRSPRAVAVVSEDHRRCRANADDDIEVTVHLDVGCPGTSRIDGGRTARC